MTTPRPPWAIDARSATYALIGAALYGVLGLYVASVGSLVLRPGFALVPFFGYSFGPLAGFVTGFVGQAIVEGIGGVAPADSWTHGLASGLVGLIAGFAAWYIPRLVHGTLVRRAIGGGIAGVVGSLVGGLAVVLQAANGTALGSIVSDSYLPLAIGHAAVAIVLVPILVYAWDPLSESLSA